MLKINRIVIENFCQHEKVDLSLNAGIVSLTGVNGAGKSNLIRALFYGLTGEVLGSDKREDLLRWGSCEGSVTLYVTDGEHDFNIIRTIHNGKHKLNSTKYGKLSKKSEVNELISSLIGLDVKLLGQVVFVPQGKLDDLLKTEHSDRVRTFNRLFGLDAAEKHRDVLQAFKGKIINYPDREAEVKEDVEKVAECKELLDHVKKEQTEISEIMEGLETQRPLFESALLAPSYEEVHKLLDEKTEAHRLLDVQLGEKQIELETMPEQAVQISEEETRRAHAATNLNILHEQCVAVHDSLEAFDRQVPKLEPRVHTEDQIKQTQDRLTDFQKKYDLAKEGKCQECEQPYIMTPEDIQTLTGLLNNTKDEYRKLTDVESQYKATEARYTLEYEAWAEGQRHVMAEKEALEKQYEDAQELAKGFDLEAYNEKRNQLDEYHKFAMVRQQLQADIMAIKPAMGKVVAEIEMAAQQQEAAVTVEIKKRAEDVLTKMNVFSERRTALELQEASLNTALIMSQDRLTKAQAENAAHESNTKATILFERAREVLHPDMLPKMTARQAIGCFNKLIGKYLALFHTPFTLKLNNDMDFRCGFSGKEDASITALSGGQRVVAALTTRFALMEMLTYGCGLLVLDEPTAYLDTDNIRALLDVLKEASAHVESHGITVIVPTHEEVVATACTEAITV